MADRSQQRFAERGVGPADKLGRTSCSPFSVVSNASGSKQGQLRGDWRPTFALAFVLFGLWRLDSEPLPRPNIVVSREPPLLAADPLAS